MKKIVLLLVILFSQSLESKLQAQNNAAEFCKFVVDFMTFNIEQNNAKDLNLSQMGFDTLKVEDESQDDYEIRMALQYNRRLVHENKEIYNVHYQFFPGNEAFIVIDKTSKNAFYQEIIKMEGDNFSVDIEALAAELLNMFTPCSADEKYGVVLDPVNWKQGYSETDLYMARNVKLDIFKLKNLDTDLRVVVKTCSKSSFSYVGIYLVVVDQIKEIVRF